MLSFVLKRDVITSSAYILPDGLSDIACQNRHNDITCSSRPRGRRYTSVNYYYKRDSRGAVLHETNFWNQLQYIIYNNLNYT